MLAYNPASISFRIDVDDVEEHRGRIPFGKRRSWTPSTSAPGVSIAGDYMRCFVRRVQLSCLLETGTHFHDLHVDANLHVSQEYRTPNTALNVVPEVSTPFLPSANIEVTVLTSMKRV
jgi:hypothetical protein